MIVEFNAMVQSVRALTDLVKAGNAVRNANEVASAIAEVNAQLIDAQAAVLASYQEQLTLAKRNAELEKEIVELKNWDREAERYQFAEIGSSVFAYVIKKGVESGEPSHYLCANCFEQRQKSVLQKRDHSVVASGILHKECFYCPRCKNDLFPTRSQGVSQAKLVRS